MPTKRREPAPLIAVIGCDGSGKSTVCEHLLAVVGGYGPAALVHLGRQAGNVGRALARWPLVGGLLGRLIARKVGGVHRQRDRNLTPGVLPALVVTAFTLRLGRRFRRMLALRRRGLIIVADRFPQLEIPGGNDGPSLPADARGNRFVRWLARRERAVFAWMTRHRPDLVIRLNVDLDTACARKPDHSREALRKKLAVIPRLTFSGIPVVDIDSTRPLADVLAAATAAAAGTMARRGFAVQGAARDAGERAA